MKHFVVVMLLSLFSCLAHAGDACPNAPQVGTQVFFISAILQKLGGSTTVKLVHAVKAATSADRALLLFAQTIVVDFPEYKIIDTMVSNDPSVVCAGAYSPLRTLI